MESDRKERKKKIRELKKTYREKAASLENERHVMGTKSSRSSSGHSSLNSDARMKLELDFERDLVSYLFA